MKPAQAQQVFEALQKANGGWVRGEYFLHTLYISQFHARIFELQRKGHHIEASKFISEHGFKRGIPGL
jgi:hypothetical protein